MARLQRARCTPERARNYFVGDCRCVESIGPAMNSESLGRVRVAEQVAAGTNIFSPASDSTVDMRGSRLGGDLARPDHSIGMPSTRT
jgi:hypothetical protein